MCGRYSLANVGQLGLRFEIDTDTESLEPRYNVAPSQEIPVIVHSADGRALRMMRWGFQPAWLKADSKSPPPINARAETLLERPLFRPSLAKRRCLIPADGFYEWQPVAGSSRKQPYYIRLHDGSLFALAGLFVEGKDDDGQPQLSCAIITTEPNSLMATIHNRMPAILTRDAEAAWIDPELTEAPAVLDLLHPYPPEQMEAYAVSSLVSSARNEGPELILPANR